MQSFLENMGLSASLAGDISLLAFLAIGSLLLGFVIGRFRLIHLLLHIYIAYVCVEVFRFLVATFLYGEIFVFVGVLFLLTFLGDRLFDIHARASVYGWMATFFLGFLVSGLLIAIFLHFLPASSMIWNFFSSRGPGYFTDPWMSVFWFLAPLGFLLFVNSKR